ncbi:MAG TPA: thiol:disulfide interchange protein DsbA/DsbL [Usitatibacter sp.]|nr:thiol:disulfide interchange protein DsbA/DsbL [Usitatibacter sp.]
MSLRKALALAASLLALSFGAAAQAPQPFQVLNPPQPTEGGGKIEVIEFFWYGCPHCYSLEPFVNSWVKAAPKDVVFKRVPAVPSEQWGIMAYTYYTLEGMGLLEQYHSKVFDAMHKENLNLSNRKIREEWLKKNGIDVAKYNDMEKSFTVASKVKRAAQMTAAYRVDGVPRVFVNGKYFTAPELTGEMSRVFPTVDQLVAMARKESAPAAAPAGGAPAPAKK